MSKKQQQKNVGIDLGENAISNRTLTFVFPQVCYVSDYLSAETNFKQTSLADCFF